MTRKRIPCIVATVLGILSSISWVEPSGGHPSPDAGAPVSKRLETLAPTGWTVTVTEDATPVGSKAMAAKGLKAQFQGTALVKAVGRPIAPGQVEGFALWLMPVAFVPTAETNEPGRVGGSFSGLPILIGSNQEYKVYCLTSGATMSTWPRWQEDIKAMFNLTEDPGASGPRKASRFECRDIRECALLGTLNTPKGVVYKLKLNANDPKTYFVQLGDYVGDYLLSDQETTTEGKVKVMLKKGTEAITLSEQDKKK